MAGPEAISADWRTPYCGKPSHATRERWRQLLPKARYWEYDGIRDFKKEASSWWEE